MKHAPGDWFLPLTGEIYDTFGITIKTLSDEDKKVPCLEAGTGVSASQFKNENKTERR